eukprot:m51a1_g11033 hypothetical protein (141) ;mRNA; f:425798-426347
MARIDLRRLLPHERELLSSGALVNVTHQGSSSAWLQAPEHDPPAPGRTRVYRPMGDAEFAHLMSTGLLPATQPYQTIVEGPEGRAYAAKYLTGRKWVDTAPTTVVEFDAPAELVRRLFEMQCKAEDGALGTCYNVVSMPG